MDPPQSNPKKQKIIFQFPRLQKAFMVAVNDDFTIEEYRNLFSQKVDFDFTYVEMKACIRSEKRNIPVAIPIKDWLSTLKGKEEPRI